MLHVSIAHPPSATMEAFRKNYSVYYSVLCFTGLWPYEESTLSKIKRTVVSLLTLCCIAVQVFSIKYVEMTLHNLLTMLSYTGPMLLFFLRYVGFIVNFSVMRCILENMQHDCDVLVNPNEVKIFFKYINKSRLIVYMFLGMSFVGILAVLVMFLIPTLLQFKYQVRIMQLFGFFYTEYDTRTDLICLHITLTTVLGLLSVSCTEAALAVFSFYLSGLFEIVGYRIRSTVDKAARLASTDPIDIGPAVDMHHRAHGLAIAFAKNILVSYMLAILTVVGSFAVNLYRVFLSVTENDSWEQIAVPILVTLIHLLIMFLNNYSGQSVIDTSSQIFVESYNSVWYLIPPKSQKMLLLVLVNSLEAVKINLAGLFIPSYEGFSMMMSSSFSYFTVLLSV